MEICKASPKELTQIYANVHESWPHHPDRDIHIKLRLESVQHQYASWYMGHVNGEIVASLGWYPFEFKDKGKIYHGAGIGAVHTPPQFRRQGYAQQLLQGVHAIMKGKGVDISHLYSDIDPCYYQKLGYQICPTVHVSHQPQAGELSNGLQIKPWKPSGWEQRDHIYRLFGPETTFHRCAKHWQWLEQRFPRTQHVQVFHNDDQPIGYLSFSAAYRTYPQQLIDAVFPKDLPFSQICTLVEQAAWLAGMRAEFIAWYPSSVAAGDERAKAASKEIPMILRLNDAVPPYLAESLWFFPMEHI
ncbi:MAG: GNAT family N-acetyltransferase [Oligoflexus sp.]